MAKAKTKSANAGRNRVENEKAPKSAIVAGSFSEDDNLDDVDTSFPLLREDTYVCEFASYAREQSKSGDVEFGHFVFKTTEKGRDTEDKPVAPGFALHKRVNLTENENRDAGMIRRDMARIVRDGFGKSSVNALRPGDRVLIRVRNSRERTDEKTGRTYPPASEPASFSPYK